MAATTLGQTVALVALLQTAASPAKVAVQEALEGPTYLSSRASPVNRLDPMRAAAQVVLVVLKEEGRAQKTFLRTELAPETGKMGKTNP